MNYRLTWLSVQCYPSLVTLIKVTRNSITRSHSERDIVLVYYKIQWTRS